MTAGKIIQVATFRIRAGALEAFRRSIERAVAFAEAHGPQLLVQVHVDRVAMRAHSIQIQRDSQAILEHWTIADPHIAEVMRQCTLERLDIYGDPSPEVMQRIGDAARNGVAVTVTPAFAGFDRFPVRAG